MDFAVAADKYGQGYQRAIQGRGVVCTGEMPWCGSCQPCADGFLNHYVKDARGPQYLPGRHFDTSVDPWRRPRRWSEGEGHAAIERRSTPEGVVGEPSLATAEKAERPIAAILRYLTLVIDQILDAYPSGKLPPANRPDRSAGPQGARALPEGAVQPGLEAGVRAVLQRIESDIDTRRR